ncbi:jg26091, partial [Pararge aegeria aegeria]
MTAVKSAFSVITFAVILSDVTSWIVDMAEVENLESKEQFDEGNYDDENLSGVASEDDNEIMYTANYAEKFNHETFKKKEVESVIKNGGVYLEGLSDAMSVYRDTLDDCNKLFATQNSSKDNHGIVLFADDTSLMFKIKRRELALDDVNNYLAKVVQWFEANNLVLNENKTKCIKFTLPNVKHVKTTILLNNEELNPVDTTVFLGITLDAKLQWGPHVNNLSNRLSSAAYAVKKIRHLTDIETARLVYFSYFHSIMSYGILLWGNAADIGTIFVLQKKAVRAIYKTGPRESLKDKFKDVKIMTLYSQYIFENLIDTLNIIMKLQPNMPKTNTEEQTKCEKAEKKKYYVQKLSEMALLTTDKLRDKAYENTNK